MKMKMKTKIKVKVFNNYKKVMTILFLITAVLTTVLTACDAESPTNNTNNNDVKIAPDSNADCIVYNNEVLYTVIRSDISSKAVTDAAVTLRKYIQENITGEIRINTDWVKNNESVEDVRGEYEILVGQTNRPESIEAYEKYIASDEPLEYMIEKYGNHYVILGNDDAIMQAVEAFIENITVYNEGSIIKVTENINLSATKQFPVNLLTIDGVGIKDFKIVYPSSYRDSQRMLAVNVQEYIYLATGFYVDVISDNEPEAEHEILIGTSRGNSYNSFNDLDCTLEVRDGNLYVGGKNYYADAKAINYLINDFLYYNMYGKNPAEIKLTPSDSKTYESKSYDYDIVA